MSSTEANTPPVGEREGEHGPDPDPRELICHKTPVYRLGLFLCKCWLWTLHRMRIENRDNVPAQGGVLIVSNHQSVIDIPLIASGTRRHVCFVARDTLARSRLLAFVMRHSGAILIQRGRPDRQAVRDMVEHLRRGDAVTIFPEGTRSLDGSLREFRAGALLAARKAGCPIVPAGIRGSVDAFPKGARLPRFQRVAVRFGEAVDPKDPEALERVQGQIRDMIGGGHYASVPPI